MAQSQSISVLYSGYHAAVLRTLFSSLVKGLVCPRPLSDPLSCDPLMDPYMTIKIGATTMYPEKANKTIWGNYIMQSLKL